MLKCFPLKYSGVEVGQNGHGQWDLAIITVCPGDSRMCQNKTMLFLGQCLICDVVIRMSAKGH